MTNAVFKELIHMGMGEEAALELANLTDTSHLATKEDVLVLQESILQVRLDTRLGIEKHREETSKQFSGMREEMAEFKRSIGLEITEFKRSICLEITEFKHSVDTRFNSVEHAMGAQRQEFLAEISDVRGEIKDVRGEIKDVRGRMKNMESEIKDIRSEIKDIRSEIKDIRVELKETRGELIEQLAGFHADLKAGIYTSNRQYILTFGGLLVTIAVVLAVNVYFR